VIRLFLPQKVTCANPFWLPDRFKDALGVVVVGSLVSGPSRLACGRPMFRQIPSKAATLDINLGRNCESAFRAIGRQFQQQM